MNELIPFKVSEALLWKYNSWSQTKQDTFIDWLKENIKQRVAFFGGDGISGEMYYTSNFDAGGHKTDNALNDICTISKTLICLFENSDDAMIFKLTWF
jgi:hypothetical protein